MQLWKETPSESITLIFILDKQQGSLEWTWVDFFFVSLMSSKRLNKDTEELNIAVYNTVNIKILYLSKKGI